MFPVKDGTFRVMHKTVTDWLCSEESGIYRIDSSMLQRAGHQLAEYCKKKISHLLLTKETSDTLDTTGGYVLRHTVSHLLDDKDASAVDLLTDFRYLMARVEDIDRLQAEMDRAVSCLPDIKDGT